MVEKFTIEEHEKRMRDILNMKPEPAIMSPEKRHLALQKVIETARAKRGVPQV